MELFFSDTELNAKGVSGTRIFAIPKHALSILFFYPRAQS